MFSNGSWVTTVPSTPVMERMPIAAKTPVRGKTPAAECVAPSATAALSYLAWRIPSSTPAAGGDLHDGIDIK
jgi:hypothetical protein